MDVVGAVVFVESVPPIIPPISKGSAVIDRAMNTLLANKAPTIGMLIDELILKTMEEMNIAGIRAAKAPLIAVPAFFPPT